MADSGEDGLIGYAILVPLYRAQEGKRGMDCTTSSCATANAAMASAIISWPAPREIARKSGCDFLSVSAANRQFRRPSLL